MNFLTGIAVFIFFVLLSHRVVEFLLVAYFGKSSRMELENSYRKEKHSSMRFRPHPKVMITDEMAGRAIDIKWDYLGNPLCPICDKDKRLNIDAVKSFLNLVVNGDC